MRKSLLFTTLASVALVGCVNDENYSAVESSQLLRFDAPAMFNQTRNHIGEITPSMNYPTSEHFTVFAIEHEGDFKGWNENNVIKNGKQQDFFPAEGEIVTNGEGEHWHTSTDYYLPTEPNRMLSFAAYSPSRAKNDGTITYGANGLVVEDWRMPDQNPYDLMYSDRTINVKQAEVPITFRHSLSSIHFAFAKPELNGPYQVLITKVAIKGTGTSIMNVGTFQDRTETFNTKGTPIWSNLKATNVPSEYLLYQGDPFEVPTSNASEISGVRFFMPIPQNITSDMKIVLSYTIKQKESDAGELVENLEIPFTSFKFNETEHTSAWVINTRYYYNITFGALTKILFHPSVAEWTTVQNAGTYVIK